MLLEARKKVWAVEETEMKVWDLGVVGTGRTVEVRAVGEREMRV